MSKLDDAIQGGVQAPIDDAWHVYMENLFAKLGQGPNVHPVWSSYPTLDSR